MFSSTDRSIFSFYFQLQLKILEPTQVVDPSNLLPGLPYRQGLTTWPVLDDKLKKKTTTTTTTSSSSSSSSAAAAAAAAKTSFCSVADAKQRASYPLNILARQSMWPPIEISSTSTSSKGKAVANKNKNTPKEMSSL